MSKKFKKNSYKDDGYYTSVKNNDNFTSITANKHAINICLTSKKYK